MKRKCCMFMTSALVCQLELEIRISLWNKFGFTKYTDWNCLLRSQILHYCCSAWDCDYLAPQGVLSLLSYITQYYPHRGSTAHNEPGSPASIINQENASHACSQANLIGIYWQKRFPLPKDPSLCQVDIKTSQNTYITHLHTPHTCVHIISYIIYIYNQIYRAI